MILRRRTALVAFALLLTSACGAEPEALVVTGTLGTDARARAALVVARLDGDLISRSPGEPDGGFALAIVGQGALEITLLEAGGETAARLAGPTGRSAPIQVCGPGVLDVGPVELDAASCEPALLCDEAAAEEALCREEGRLRCDASADAISGCLLAENNQCRNYLTAMIGCFAIEDPCPQVRSGLVACAAAIGCGEDAAAFVADCGPVDCPPPTGCPASCAGEPLLLRTRRALATSVGCSQVPR